MKKNLAKRITLSILAGAMLMSSSVAWANYYIYNGDNWVKSTDDNGRTDSIAILGTVESNSKQSIAIGVDSKIGADNASATNSVAIGYKSGVTANNSVALGADAKVLSAGSHVALGYGSVVSNETCITTEPVVSVGYGGASGGTTNIGTDNDPINVPNTRSIINVTDVSEDNRMIKDGNVYKYGSYAVNVNTLNKALDGYYTKEDVNQSLVQKADKTEMETIIDGKIGDVDNGFMSANYIKYVHDFDLVTAVLQLDEAIKDTEDKFVTKVTTTGEDGKKETTTQVTETFSVVETVVDTSTKTTTVTINADAEDKIVMDNEGITVGQNSARIDGSGFYVWDGGAHTAANAKASMTKDGKVVAEQFIIKNGTDEIDIKNELDKKASQSDLDTEKTERMAADQVLQTQIDNIGGGASDAIAGINQRLDKTNAKINKVGAGAAALAALHPLEYDPDDKLTFSAGMGNYAGENAAALGAFYRPNEKFMVSLGGTMGNGENMVNLGLSIGLDKPNGCAKLSKRELIQEVNAVKAENAAMKDQLANADERIAKLEALVAQLVNK